MSLQRRFDGGMAQWSGMGPVQQNNFSPYYSAPINPQYFPRPTPRPAPLPTLPPVPKPFELTDSPTTPMTPTEKRLDAMTRSRNALIITAIILSAAFLGCFIGLLIVLFPPPSLLNLDVQVISTRRDFSYQADDLSSSSNYAYKVMETTMCSQVTGAASSVVTITKCYCSKFEDGSPGVKAYVRLQVPLDGQTPTERVTAIGTAVITSAAEDADWNVGTADVSVIAPGSGSATTKSINLPLLLMLLYILHRFLCADD